MSQKQECEGCGREEWKVECECINHLRRSLRYECAYICVCRVLIRCMIFVCVCVCARSRVYVYALGTFVINYIRILSVGLVE